MTYGFGPCNAGTGQAFELGITGVSNGQDFASA